MATVGLSALGGIAYAYDATGRIVARDISLGDASSPSNPSQSQPSPMSHSFHRTYSYDDLDRLAMDGDVSYTYDAAGNRTAKIDPAQGSTLYTLGLGDRLATYGRARSPSAPLSAVGSYAYDTAGNVMYIIAYFDYDAWGNILSATSTVPALVRNRYRFQGREWSAATGLTNFRMRWYDAETGRWLSKDSIGLSGGLNLYAFCGNDAVDYVDSIGCCKKTIVTPGGRKVPIPPGVDINSNIVVAGNNKSLLWFRNQVRNKGPWDYKQQGRECEDFGNFNYGATGSAIGIPSEVLLRAAGVVQQMAGTSKPEWGNPWDSSGPYGDDPVDQHMIQEGISYYNNFMNEPIPFYAGNLLFVR